MNRIFYGWILIVNFGNNGTNYKISKNKTGWSKNMREKSIRKLLGSAKIGVRQCRTIKKIKIKDTSVMIKILKSTI